jgi:hypothetical protein
MSCIADENELALVPSWNWGSEEEWPLFYIVCLPDI